MKVFIKEHVYNELQTYFPVFFASKVKRLKYPGQDENEVLNVVYVLLVMLIKQQPEYFPQTSGTPPVADLRGALPARTPLRAKIFSISCSFSENLPKS